MNRSSGDADRAAYFSAQFSLTHACWLITYPLVGYLGDAISLELAGAVIVALIIGCGVLGSLIWPRHDPRELRHTHDAVYHSHYHRHDRHHDHPHEGMDAAAPGHKHWHSHAPITHAHTFYIDAHHRRWPDNQ